MTETAKRKKFTYRLKPLKAEFSTDIRRPATWRDLFMIYWLSAYLGHLGELIWVNLPVLIGKPPINVLPMFVTAAPYGLAGLAIMLILYKPTKHGKIGALGVFLLGTILGGIIELICAEIIVATSPDHRNHFWTYVNQPFNYKGYICLRNCIVFGVGSVLAVYIGIPIVCRIINELKDRTGSVLTWALAIIICVGYSGSQITTYLGYPPSKMLHITKPHYDITGVCIGRNSCPPPQKYLTKD